MDYQQKTVDNVLVVNINLPEASLNQSEDFRKYLYDVTTETSPKLVLDMEQIKYMDSSFIGALVVGLKNVLSKGGEMALININADVMALFELTRLDKVFKIYNNLDEAILALK